MKKIREFNKIRFYIINCSCCGGEYLGVRNMYTCRLCGSYGSKVVTFREHVLKLENGVFNVYE